MKMYSFYNFLLNRLMYWIIYVNLTRVRITLGEGTSIERLSPLENTCNAFSPRPLHHQGPTLNSCPDFLCCWFLPRFFCSWCLCLCSCLFTAIEILPKTAIGSRSCSTAVTKLTVFGVGLVLILKLEAEEPAESSEMSVEYAVLKRKERLWFSSDSFVFWVDKKSVMMAGFISTRHS